MRGEDAARAERKALADAVAYSKKIESDYVYLHLADAERILKILDDLAEDNADPFRQDMEDDLK